MLLLLLVVVSPLVSPLGPFASVSSRKLCRLGPSSPTSTHLPCAVRGGAPARARCSMRSLPPCSTTSSRIYSLIAWWTTGAGSGLTCDALPASLKSPVASPSSPTALGPAPPLFVKVREGTCSVLCVRVCVCVVFSMLHDHLLILLMHRQVCDRSFTAGDKLRGPWRSGGRCCAVRVGCAPLPAYA